MPQILVEYARIIYVMKYEKNVARKNVSWQVLLEESDLIACGSGGN